MGDAALLPLKAQMAKIERGIEAMGAGSRAAAPADDGGDALETFCRMAQSMCEEMTAIRDYEQRMADERDPQARAILGAIQEEKCQHFAMELEFLRRSKPQLSDILEKVLFQGGDIAAHGAAAA